MNDSQWRQYTIALIACGAIAGAFSGIIWLMEGWVVFAMILPGALLGGCMGAAVAMISRSGPANPSGMGRVLRIALVAGMVPGILIAGYYAAFDLHGIHWSSGITAVYYSVLLIGLYHLRHRWGIVPSVLLMLIAGAFCGFLRGHLAFPPTHDNNRLFDHESFVTMSGLYGGLPFAVFWTLAVCQADPAYSQARWERLFPRPEPDAPPETGGGTF